MGLLLRKIHLKRHVHPNLHGSTASKSQTTEATNREIDIGLDNMTWSKHTQERHEAIQTKGKNATGSDKEGPSEDPRKPSPSDRGRPISYSITSRRKLKIQSHRLIEKRDTDSHPENPLGVPTGETSEGNPSGVWIITDIRI